MKNWPTKIIAVACIVGAITFNNYLAFIGWCTVLIWIKISELNEKP